MVSPFLSNLFNLEDEDLLYERFEASEMLARRVKKSEQLLFPESVRKNSSGNRGLKVKEPKLKSAPFYPDDFDDDDEGEDNEGGKKLLNQGLII